MSNIINLSKAHASLMYKALEQSLKEKEVVASKLIAEIEADKTLLNQLSRVISGEINAQVKEASDNSQKHEHVDYNPEWALLEKIDYTLNSKKEFMTAGEIATFIYNIDSKYPNFNDLKATVASTLSPYAKSNKRYQRFKDDQDSAFKYGLIDWNDPIL
ncbi:hypothetical protein [Fluviicola chungangensis]|uniref:Uncharacterized protein n=1 Tax=Fluviicola chungangensis TaxID=2597671 RepID=A0A556N2L2_9FLAO|nr:hypothetical protein [Fluviicola chungangensis]TSJ46289.1 hypothetical protein FO442_03800 [Fluviicola chungangensis]